MAMAPKSKKVRSVRKAGRKKAPSRSSTRTSSRSAKRRSPKQPPPDPELLEMERLEFLRAMDRYKRKTGKTFPTWTEVLEVLRSIGWVSQAKLRFDREKAG
jgi:hypothetical protein